MQVDGHATGIFRYNGYHAVEVRGLRDDGLWPLDQGTKTSSPGETSLVATTLVHQNVFLEPALVGGDPMTATGMSLCSSNKRHRAECNRVRAALAWPDFKDDVHSTFTSSTTCTSCSVVVARPCVSTATSGGCRGYRGPPSAAWASDSTGPQEAAAATDTSAQGLCAGQSRPQRGPLFQRRRKLPPRRNHRADSAPRPAARPAPTGRGQASVPSEQKAPKSRYCMCHRPNAFSVSSTPRYHPGCSRCTKDPNACMRTCPILVCSGVGDGGIASRGRGWCWARTGTPRAHVTTATPSASAPSALPGPPSARASP